MPTQNARVAAVAAPLGAAGGLALKFASMDLTPLQVLCLAITSFGVWAFADEMGVQRPLNRAGLVAFAFAALAKLMVLLRAGGDGKFLILYAFALLAALLLWSVALLHRRGAPRLVGAVGTLGALAPIALLIAGHVVVGAGAIFGLSALYEASVSAVDLGLPVITLLEAVLLAWTLLVAKLLWSSDIQASAG